MTTFNKYRLKGAYHYDWYETEDWYKYLINRAVKFCKGSTVDMGCGDGLFLYKLWEHYKTGNDYLGVDISLDGLRIALEKVPGASFQWSDIDEFDRNLGYSFPKYQYLACINTIEHLEKPEAIKDIIEHDITKGAIITTIDYQGGAFGEDHKKEYTLDKLVEFFKEFKPKPFRYKDTEWIGVEILK